MRTPSSPRSVGLHFHPLSNDFIPLIRSPRISSSLMSTPAMIVLRPRCPLLGAPTGNNDRRASWRRCHMIPLAASEEKPLYIREPQKCLPNGHISKKGGYHSCVRAKGTKCVPLFTRPLARYHSCVRAKGTPVANVKARAQTCRDRASLAAATPAFPERRMVGARRIDCDWRQAKRTTRYYNETGCAAGCGCHSAVPV